MNHSQAPQIDEALVKRLIAGQFPQWADLPLASVQSGGTDNVIFRLGEHMSVRIPRVDWAIGQVEKEHKWLPSMASMLPLPIPTPIAMGMPALDYPWRWSVNRWLEGDNAVNEPIGDLPHAAHSMASFLRALQQFPSTEGPAPGPHNSGRGEPLMLRDAAVRKAIEALHDVFDRTEATKAWEASLHAPKWEGEPVWLHGDLHPGNLLVQNNRLSAVIDFGLLGVGDPACDCMCAWTVLNDQSRPAFREGLAVDDVTWLRGSGWALSFGLTALAYYRHTNPVLSDISRRTIEEVLTDHRGNHI
ncbi:aminoglycoside phosphotransferase family protein [Brevibacillus centrosporus]|uniref:aminoglycoside phosphotransferase family protein n=1 Tax=Brevibacillus centrosporus TaxID=54910 RepID=UPI003B024BFE